MTLCLYELSSRDDRGGDDWSGAEQHTAALGYHQRLEQLPFALKSALAEEVLRRVVVN